MALESEDARPSTGTLRAVERLPRHLLHPIIAGSRSWNTRCFEGDFTGEEMFGGRGRGQQAWHVGAGVLYARCIGCLLPGVRVAEGRGGLGHV